MARWCGRDGTARLQLEVGVRTKALLAAAAKGTSPYTVYIGRVGGSGTLDSPYAARWRTRGRRSSGRGMARLEDDDSGSEIEVESDEYLTGRWTPEEHERFLYGLKEYNKQWKLIADLIRTRTVVQVRTHAQKHFQKMARMQAQAGRAAAAAAANAGAAAARETPPSSSASERPAPVAAPVARAPAAGGDSRRRSRRTSAMAASAAAAAVPPPAPAAAAAAAPSPSAKRRKSAPGAMPPLMLPEQQRRPTRGVSITVPPQPHTGAYPTRASTAPKAVDGFASAGLHVSSTLLGAQAVPPRPSPTSVADLTGFSLETAFGSDLGSVSWLTDQPELKPAPPSDSAAAAAAVTAPATIPQSYPGAFWLDAAGESSATASVSSDGEGGWGTESEMGPAPEGILDLDLTFPDCVLDGPDPVFGPSLAGAPSGCSAAVGAKRPRDALSPDDVIGTELDLLSLEPLPLSAAAARRAAEAPAALEEVDQDVDSFVRSLLRYPPQCTA